MVSKLITSIVFAKDEAHRLPLVFRNLSDFSKIIVFDGGSTDKTREVCEIAGVGFVERPGYLRNEIGGDCKFAYERVETPYLLNVNCSHLYPPKLLELFKQIAQEGRFKAVYHTIDIYTYCSVVHRPFFRRKSTAANFYHQDAINFSNSVVHNEAPVEVREALKWHAPSTDEYSVKIFRDYNIKKAESNHSFYGDLEAQQRYETGVRTSIVSILLRPTTYFIHQYLRCGSICYGMPGFIYSVMYAQLELNIQLKIWELQNSYDMPSIIRGNLLIRSKMLDEQVTG